MTEHEIAIFKMRLTRVWSPWRRRPDAERRPPTHSFFAAHLNQNNWIEAKDVWLVLYRTRTRDEGSVFCRRDNGAIVWYADPKRPETLAPFKNQWMDIFRRNSWLSGYPVEASDTEKAEWVRGFTRQEIESWELHI